MVTAGGVSTVGSTFLPSAPDPEALAPQLVAHGARFVPALAGAAIVRSRVCARPQSVDGRPFIGPVNGMDRVFVTAGHGPWGISTGTGLGLAGRGHHPGRRADPGRAPGKPLHRYLIGRAVCAECTKIGTADALDRCARAHPAT